MKSAIFYPSLVLGICLLNQPVKTKTHTVPLPYADTILHDPAPGFTLKDIDGKNVSLSDFKGKVLVLDFWATWCPPCKKAFPAIQMAINRYKNDPAVAFLFIDTWEKSANSAGLVRKFLAENQYTFKVLCDETITGGIPNETYYKYEVEGLPTQFIIDRNGLIRFKSGYHEMKDPEEGAREISQMIEKVRVLNYPKNL